MRVSMRINEFLAIFSGFFLVQTLPDRRFDHFGDGNIIIPFRFYFNGWPFQTNLLQTKQDSLPTMFQHDCWGLRSLGCWDSYIKSAHPLPWDKGEPGYWSSGGQL